MTTIGPPETPSPFKSPEELVDEKLIHTYQTWRELRGERFAPKRSEISPARFKTSLPVIFLVDVIDGGADFRLALGGDKLMQFLGGQFHPGALLFHVSFVAYRERTARLLGHCVDAKTPIALGPARTLHDEHNFLAVEVVVLPLSNDGESVTGLLGAVSVSATFSS